MRTIWRWTKMSSVRMELLCHKFSMTISSQSKWQRKFAPYRKVIWHSCYFSNVITGFTFLVWCRNLSHTTSMLITMKVLLTFSLSLLSLCRKHRFQLQGKLAPLNCPQFDDGYRWTIQNWILQNWSAQKTDVAIIFQLTIFIVIWYNFYKKLRRYTNENCSMRWSTFFCGWNKK